MKGVCGVPKWWLGSYFARFDFFLFPPITERLGPKNPKDDFVLFKPVTATARYIVHTVIDYFSVAR